jgi:hypothetical protein
MSSLAAVYIFIDALDEYPAASVEALLQEIIAVHNCGVQALHMLLTSQPHRLLISGHLTSSIHQQYQFDLENMVHLDILAHIRNSIRESPQLRDRWGAQNPRLFEHIEHVLTEECNGSYVATDNACLIMAHVVFQISLG